MAKHGEIYRVIAEKFGQTPLIWEFDDREEAEALASIHNDLGYNVKIRVYAREVTYRMVSEWDRTK